MDRDTSRPEPPNPAARPAPAKPGAAAQARREREAAALRQNLLRRKQHARSQAQPAEDPADKP